MPVVAGNSLRHGVIFAALISLGVAPAVAAQEGESPGPKLLDQIALSNTRANKPSIRVDVDLALVPVTVVDPLGRNVLGLERENFEIHDGKEPRQIVSFSRQDAPVSVGIIFDSSGSMAAKLAAARTAVAELFKQLNPADEAFLVGVVDRPEVRVPVSSDPAAITETLLFSKAGGLTPLIDAVYLGVSRMRRASNPRKALVVVSDGGDNNSRYTLPQLLSYAAEAETQIYSIGLVEDPHSPEEAAGPQLLEKFTERTGGRSFVVQNIAGMRDAMARIGVTLHNEYVLGYYPPDGVPSGKYRKIKVGLKLPSGLPKLQIYARGGYYTPNR